MALLLAALALGVPTARSLPPPPTITLLKATIDRTARTADVRLRICFAAGPRAVLSISERRTVNGVVAASRTWTPSGVEPRRISPFACRANWRVNWLLERKLAGRGTYLGTIRVRDAYGRWTSRVAFSVTSA